MLMTSYTDESGLPLIDYGIDFYAGPCIAGIISCFFSLLLTLFLTSKGVLYEKNKIKMHLAIFTEMSYSVGPPSGSSPGFTPSLLYLFSSSVPIHRSSRFRD